MRALDCHVTEGDSPLGYREPQTRDGLLGMLLATPTKLHIAGAPGELGRGCRWSPEVQPQRGVTQRSLGQALTEV